MYNCHDKSAAMQQPSSAQLSREHDMENELTRSTGTQKQPRTVNQADSNDICICERVYECVCIPGALSRTVQKAICLMHNSLYLMLDALPQLVGIMNEAHALLTGPASYLCVHETHLQQYI